MFYPTNLKTGEKVELSWHYKLFRTGCLWPLKPHTSGAIKFVYNGIAFLCMISYFIFMSVALNYIIKERILNYKLQCTIIEMALFACQFRIIHFMYMREQFCALLNKFYTDIVLRADEKGVKTVAFMMRPIEFMCISYVMAYVWFATQPSVSYYILGFSAEPLPKRILDSYGIQGYLSNLWYILVLWVTMTTATFMAVESYLFGLCLSHLYARFKNLYDEIQNAFVDVITSDIVLAKQRYNFLNLRLKGLLRKQEDLKKFGETLNENFSFRYFVLVFSGGVLLCLVVFVISEGTQEIVNIMFVFWAIAAVIEQIAVGYIGSELLDLSENMFLAYYSCNWESILLSSSVTNVQKKLLLKDLSLAMMLSTKPTKITGIGFFDLSVLTAFNTVRTAISYFMFLNTMNSAQSK